ncbi:hypothetical protein ACN28C_25155 [Plantactinospora sp. WMMC1484]|uniref:hypothetical protein n=1 Tax=Plantactinospora sp. WMMC1484 TaxID=3404122 RepID=UPI003BF59F59
MDVLRVRRRRTLESVVWYYRHSAVTRWITVVAVHPQGEAAYFLTVRTIANRGRTGGARVYYEELLSPSGGERRVLHPDVRRVIDRVGEWEVLRIARAGVLGWVDAREALRPDSDWHAHPVSTVDAVSLTGAGWIDRYVRQSLRRLDWADGSRRGPSLHRLRVATAARREARCGRTDRLGAHPALLARRATAALDALRRDDGHGVLLCAPEVLPRVAAGLADLGFTRQGSEWLPVGQLPQRGTTAVQLLLGCGPRHPASLPAHR